MRAVRREGGAPRPWSLSDALLASAAYFGTVFAVGFALGTLRVLVAVPAVGERASELLEMPLMLLACWLAARWVVRMLEVPRSARARLGVGFVALALLVAAEVLVVVFVLGVPLSEYVVERDPVSGVVYLGSLGLFALMPWLLPAGVEAEGRRDN